MINAGFAFQKFEASLETVCHEMGVWWWLNVEFSTIAMGRLV
jgi:hypothetical protein